MARRAAIAVVALSFAVLAWRYPPVRISRLEQRTADATPAGKIDPGRFVDQFWNEQLTPALAEARPASEVVALVKHDVKAAREKFGRSVGMSRGSFYLVAGDGTVVSVDRNGVSVALTTSGAPELILVTGPVFGNAVRDSTGLLSASDFADSQDFNAIAAELNRRVETGVQPALRNAARTGRRVRFVACIELRSEAPPTGPLNAVPLSVDFD